MKDKEINNGMETSYIGTQLRRRRVQLNMTQQELADKLGMNRSIVSAYETGMSMPTYGKLLKLAGIFGVSTDYLLGVENESVLDLSGLDEGQMDSVKKLVEAMKQEEVRDKE